MKEEIIFFRNPKIDEYIKLKVDKIKEEMKLLNWDSLSEEEFISWIDEKTTNFIFRLDNTKLSLVKSYDDFLNNQNKEGKDKLTKYQIRIFTIPFTGDKNLLLYTTYPNMNDNDTKFFVQEGSLIIKLLLEDTNLTTDFQQFILDEYMKLSTYFKSQIEPMNKKSEDAVIELKNLFSSYKNRMFFDKNLLSQLQNTINSLS